ncbi:MAG TPA: hybrid sensor histidine kinase/response regulator [Steroidobacteraceae bacterium]|nr:hybrid sensor histidine kinase/response regulator [Steroidobacteraceae bacterium]
MPAKRKSRSPTTAAQLRRLRDENVALRKTVRALMDRVERAVDDQGTPFSWFQAAAKLEETVRLRTRQSEQLNDRLKRELESRREIELALKHAKQQAELANQSKTRFLAAASHDLRQPLNSALLFLESMNEHAMAASDRDLVRRSRVALAALNNLLGTLLDVARLDSGDIEPNLVDFPVAALLERLGPEFQAVARAAGIELTFRLSDTWVRTDVHLLETVLRNLISNAIRYTPRGRVLIGCRRRAQGLMICVYDTGVGIESAHLEAIFDAYYQVPSAARRHNTGIGLGLSIVSRIATLLSLARVVRSRPGKGSLFAVIVPYGSAGRDAPRPWQPATLDSHSRRSHPSLVVVIDDNPDALVGMSAVLEKWGCRTVSAAAATDAVVQLISADVAPDLIVSDYHLADGTKGDEAIAEIQRELDRQAPAAIMTSDPDPALRKRLQARGFTVLDKPVNLAKLRALLARLP